MTSGGFPSDEVFTNYARQRIALYPEKFGIMGLYSLEMLEACASEEMLGYATDSLALRLTTSVLCGHTISEKPEVELNLPETPWQHLKHKLGGWQDRAWREHHGNIKWKLWLWVVCLVALAAGKFLEKRPVKWTVVKAAVNFEQRVLYPEVSMPAQAGRAVIYETLDVSYPETQPPFGSGIVNNKSRFYNRHEIASKIYRDETLDSYVGSRSAETILLWLERHGVNVDQLVRRG